LLWILFACLIYVAFAFIVIVSQHKRPARALAWTFVSLALPYVGFAVYIILAAAYRRRSKQSPSGSKRGAAAAIAISLPGLDRGMLMRLSHMPDASFTSGNEIVVLSDGKELFESLLKAIDEATHHIHFHFYILRSDESGSRFLRALTKKAQQGVNVRVLIDGVGSSSLSGKYVKALRDNGVQVQYYLPFLKSLFSRRLNYRNHRKNVVIDGKIAYFGGFNIGDEYVGGNPKLGYWRDTHIAVQGAAVQYLQQLFLKDWYEASGEIVKLPETAEEQSPLERAGALQLIASGPDDIVDSAYEAYFGAIVSARQRIFIATPYFIPNSGLAIALKTAVRSGIDVRIIVPGVTDHAFVQWGTLAFAQDMLRAGVRVYRYRIGFMHAKSMLIDNDIAIVGSANMDVRSFFDNFELTAVVFDPKAVQALEQDFYRDLGGSDELSPGEYQVISPLQRAKETLARIVSPLL